LYGSEQPAVVYVGDGLATSGELSGEQIVERLRRALSTSRARLFTVGIGSDADLALLDELADAGGGQSFRVDTSEETTGRALELTAAIKLPTITDFELDLGAGLDEPFSNTTGKVSRGSEVTVLARTHHDIPTKVKVKGRFAGKSFEKEYTVESDQSVMSAFVPRGGRVRTTTARPSERPPRGARPHRQARRRLRPDDAVHQRAGARE